MREYFINADFDLSLRRSRPSATDDARACLARELPMHMLLLGVEGDSVLAPAAPDGGFLDYLGRLQIPAPDVRIGPSLTGRAEFTPFGWNEEAEGLNNRYDEPSPHPPLEVVRRVNGRAFAAEVERRHWGGEHVIAVVHSVDEVNAALAGRPPGETGWVFKSEHGNGAFANRRLRSRILDDADRATVARLLTEDGTAVLERWRARRLDLASIFDVTVSGKPTALLTYEVVNSADGAFFGDIFERDPPALDRWGAEVRSMAAVVARELGDTGYFGPVCVDSFVWDDDGVERLRPVVDINARLFMAAGVERLWRIWGRERVISWRLFSARRLRLPGEHADLEKALGEDAFDPGTRSGVAVTSPMEVDGRRARRVGVLLAGDDRESVDALDRRFRERFAR